MKNDFIFQCQEIEQFFYDGDCDFEYNCENGEDESKLLCKRRIQRSCDEFSFKSSENIYQSNFFLKNIQLTILPQTIHIEFYLEKYYYGKQLPQSRRMKHE